MRAPRPHDDRLPLFLGLTLVCILGAVAVYLVAVHTELGQRVDTHLRGGILQDENPVAYTATSELLDTISVWSLALMGAAVMGIALARRRPHLAVGVGVLVLGANVTTQLLKRGLSRPDLVPGLWPEPGSYPSGHVTVAMSLAMALILVVPATMRMMAAVIGSVYALGVGVAVIALDWHRPSDVLGAYLVVTAWTGLVAAALILLPDRTPEVDRPPAPRWWGLVLAGLVAAFVAIVAVRLAARADVLRIASDRTAFVATAVICSAVGAALLIAVTTLVGRPGTGNPRRPGAARRDAAVTPVE